MILEDFADPYVDRRASVRPPPDKPANAVPDRSYEDGYRQGWDDAAARIRDDDTRIGARAASRLEGLAHTQRAAMALCLGQIEPLLTEVFDKLLPAAADRGFLRLVVEEAEAMLGRADGRVLTLRVAPETLEPLRATLAEAGADLTAYRLEAEPELDPMQAVLAHPGAEREVDLARLLDAIGEAFETTRTTIRSAVNE